MKERIAKQLFVTSHKLRRLLDKKNQQFGITGAQGRILSIIYAHEQEKELVYQKMIEERLSIRGSSATEMISSLEESGLIIRVVSQDDKRLKQIKLTKKGREKHLESMTMLLDLEDKLYHQLTEDEVLEFNKIILKLSRLIDEEEAADVSIT